MPKRKLDLNVFDSALNRLDEIYSTGARIVVSISGGKDSTVCLELALIAAKKHNKLPVECTLRDEEISYPGTYEYLERVAARSEVEFTWVIQRHPVLNVFNREIPYIFTFDEQLSPNDWVRKPPEWATWINEKFIDAISSNKLFPPDEGQDLIAIVGLRTQESNIRTMAIASSKSFITKPNAYGCRRARPIYDWTDADVWKAIKDNDWDYNSCYDTMSRMGLPVKYIRVAPPLMSAASLTALTMSMKAWPKWFDKVDKRAPGTRTAAMFGRRAVEPVRRMGESWKDCFYRTCINDAPYWISVRSQYVIDKQLIYHSHHSKVPFPEKTNCDRCVKMRSWREAAMFMYHGDAIGAKQQFLNKTSGDPLLQRAVPPEYFRKGAGKWGTKAQSV